MSLPCWIKHCWHFVKYTEEEVWHGEHFVETDHYKILECCKCGGQTRVVRIW